MAALVGGVTMAWFTAQDSAGEATFTAGTVNIEAGRKMFIEDGGCEVVEGQFFPAEVVDFEQGSAGINLDYTVPNIRSNPYAVLTLGIGQSESNFFSLGFGGYIEVRFDQLIYPGESVVVVAEDKIGRASCRETV